MENYNKLNTLFCIWNTYDEEGNGFLADSKYILSLSSTPQCVENNLLDNNGNYSLNVEGELKFTSRQKWENYQLEESVEDNTFIFKITADKKKESLTFTFQKLKEIGELPIDTFKLVSSNGSKLFDYKFALSNGIIEEMNIKNSTCEFISKAEVKTLKDIQTKAKILNSDGVRTEVITQFVRKKSGGNFIKLHVTSVKEA